MDDPRLQTIRGLVEPILSERAMELVELTCRPQGRQLHVRILLDRVGGVTLQQCAQANRLIGDALEAADVIEGSYTVEVSSPGLDRPLATQRDFERALGEDVRLEVLTDDGRCQEMEGALLAVQPQALVLKTTAGNLTVPMAQVRFARKALRW